MTEPRIYGVDGAPGGWAVAWLDGDRLHTSLETDLRRLLSPRSVIGIDMPLGLPTQGRRSCDVLGRERLGRCAARLFHVPPREVLESRDFDEARELCIERGWPMPSLQVWNLRPKILEIDRLLQGAGPLMDRVFEVHPELSFAQISFGPIPEPKRTAEGRRLRRSALEAYFGCEVPRAAGIPEADVLDACAVLATAIEIEAGRARSLPDDPPRDDLGIPMALWV